MVDEMKELRQQDDLKGCIRVGAALMQDEEACQDITNFHLCCGLECDSVHEAASLLSNIGNRFSSDTLLRAAKSCYSFCDHVLLQHLTFGHVSES